MSTWVPVPGGWDMNINNAWVGSSLLPSQAFVSERKDISQEQPPDEGIWKSAA